MKEIIAERSTLGATDSGRDWCLKALHPSDPLTEVRGIPDESAAPTAFVNYQSEYMLVAPPTAAGKTWDSTITVFPHPISFGHATGVITTDPSEHNLVSFLNTQISGSTHAIKLDSFLETAERWRLAYMSYTVYQDGPDLSNQGSMTAVQYPVQPRKLCGTLFAAMQYAIGNRVLQWDQGDQPVYSTLINQPNAYTSNSKFGCYMPLKLTKTHQKWHGHEDLFFVAPTCPGADSGAGVYALANAAPAGVWPMPELTPIWYDAVAAETKGSLTVGPTNGNYGRIVLRGISTATSVRVVVRAGYEMQVQPGTLLAPMQRLSPQYDPEALTRYFQIAREMKDAYPADYNFLGKLASVIGNIVKTVAPVVGSLVPVPGAGLIGQGIGGLGGMLSEWGAKRMAAETKETSELKPSVTSAGDVEAARKRVEAARAAGVFRGPKQLNISRRGAGRQRAGK